FLRHASISIVNPPPIIEQTTTEEPPFCSMERMWGRRGVEKWTLSHSSSTIPITMSIKPDLDFTPSVPTREGRTSVERRRREREANGFRRLREVIQTVAPNNG
ncbi:hypothetical protein PENTCL1PPCAC_7127, partial [Pristionchus entomophagus]